MRREETRRQRARTVTDRNTAEPSVPHNPTTPWPPPPQVPTYAQCLSDHGGRTRWLAFIDLDEFLVPAGPTTPPAGGGDTGRPPTVAALLPRYEAHGGLSVRPRRPGLSL